MKKKGKFYLTKPEECAICFESLEKETAPLECGHWLHLKCMGRYNKAECPLCRKKLKHLPKKIRRKIKKNAKLFKEQEADEETFNTIDMLYNEFLAAREGESSILIFAEMYEPTYNEYQRRSRRTVH